MRPALPMPLAFSRNAPGPGARMVRTRKRLAPACAMLPLRALLATAAVASVLLISAPAPAKAPPKGFAPTLPVVLPARIPDGSIFNVSAGYAPLIEGNRAHMVGDIVNIVLSESTTTTKTAVTKTQRAGNASITPPTAGPFAINPSALNAASQSSFNGQGSTNQTDALSGTVEVSIAEVRPNGTVLVRGEKQMLFSQGTEWIQFSGIVRVADINPDTDSVLSTQVANARIEYSGNGSIQRSAREGWLSKFFNIISPF